MIRTIAVAVLCLFSTTAHAQRGATRVASQFEWRQDLEHLAEHLPQAHPDPWAKTSEEAFRAEVAELRDRMATMSEGQSTFEISRIVGLLGDQNSVAEVSRPMYLAPVLPVRFVWLADGLFVNAAATQYRSLIGTKVIGIGGVAIEEVAQRVAHYGSWENETSRQRIVADLLRYPAVLKLCEITNRTSGFTLEFERGDDFGIRELTSIPLGGTHTWWTWSQLIEGPMPVSVMASVSPYVSAFLGGTNTMFVSVNQQTESPQLPFATFVEETMADIAERNASRVVIDLRFNDDRSDSRIDPLLDALAENGWFANPGDVIVLVGRLTSASSGQDALRFSERGAVLMGVPTGGNPNGCSGETDFVLPNSGMTIRISTEGRSDGDATSVVPDVTIPWNSDAFFNASDPVLDAALEYTADPAGEG